MQTFPTPLSAKEEAFYLQRCQAGDLEARNILVERNLRLVAHIVKRYNNFERNMEDLLSIGTIGLIKAINTFDISKGNRLVTYASRCIENELLMMLRQERKISREISLYETIGTDKEGNEIQLMDVLEADSIHLLDSYLQNETIKSLYDILPECLNERELTLITLRYGLYKTAPHTQREVASLLGISRSYVSRIEKKALGKLARHLS